MMDEAQALLARRTDRYIAYLEERAAKTGTEVDVAAEREALALKVEGDTVYMPLQYLQDFLVRKIAAIQANTSMHNKKEVAELTEVLNDYGVERIDELKSLKFDHLSWSARPGQKPKLMVHTLDLEDTPVVIRFEASTELCQKFMNAAMFLQFKPGTVFDIRVQAVDPAIARNKKAGKKVADEGVYVNHNLTLTVGDRYHTGHPPQGTKFTQKPTLEQVEKLFNEARHVTSA